MIRRRAQKLRVPTETPPRTYAYLALGIGLIGLAFSAILVRIANAPGTITAFYRMAIAAALVTLPAHQRSKTMTEPLPINAVWMALLGAFFISMDLVFWTTGIMLSGAARPTLVANTAPLWVGLGSLLIFRERQTVVFWVGLVVAALGAMLVLRVDLSQGSELGLGTFLGLLAGVFYAGYHLVTQLGRVDLSALTYFWITTFGSAVVLLIVNFVFGHALTGYSVHTYLIFLITGVVVQLCGWLVINYAQGYLPASIVAPTLLAQPLLTVILAVLLLGETFSIWQIVGAGGVFAGVYLVHRSR